jgi:purine-binding chemotaxis protein CheW
MNLRGTVVPVIDARQRFSAAEAVAVRAGRIIVLTTGGLRAGFAVDAVTEIMSVSPAEISVAPDLASDGAAVFDRIATVEPGGRMVLLVDPKALLDAAERDLLATLVTRAAGRAAAKPGPKPGKAGPGAAPAP